MKKKFLTCTLCFTIIFSSLNIKKSYANPLILGKVAEVSLIYSIGRLAIDTVGFVGSVADIMDLGGSIFSKMSSDEKDSYKDSVKFEDDKFVYSEDSYKYISSYVPGKSGFHLMPNVKRSYVPLAYEGDGLPPSDITELFESNKEVIDIQGTKFDFFVYYHDFVNGYRDYYLYYKESFSESSIKYVKHKVRKEEQVFYRFYVSSVRNGWGTLSYDFVTYVDGVESSYSSILLNNVLSDSCGNCPHDISLKDEYKYPTSEELEQINKYYPQYENDIKFPGDVSNGGGSNGGGSNGGGSNGGGSNGDINNSPIISNPPSFPNLQEFDFSGLQLEPLTNLFSNFKNKFPFSLPFDLANLIGGLKQEPIPPVFETELLGETMKLDLTQFSELANLVRMFTVLSYVISLVLLTKRFGG